MEENVRKTDGHVRVKVRLTHCSLRAHFCSLCAHCCSRFAHHDLAAHSLFAQIKTASGEDAWCAKGASLEADETVTEAAPWVPTHETTVFDEPQQYRVLASCTVRTGPEKDDDKVGEYSKGALIDVVQEVTNWKGITCFQTITPAKGQLMGGWVKLETSKGKVLLERVEPDRKNTSLLGSLVI